MAKNIRVSELDFDTIKQNIINHMKNLDNTNTFKDYDFEASGLNTMIDILASNTHYQSYYLNMMANEMFLDTARLRENVVSKAKLLGYTPTSARASEATLSVLFRKTVNTEEEVKSGIRITRNISFSTNIDGVSYNFIPKINRVALKFGETLPGTGQNAGKFETRYLIEDLVVIQGDQVTETYFVDTNDPNQKFVLSNSNVDTETIQVMVQENPDEDTTIAFSKETNNMNLTDVSTTFFLQESSGYYEVYFGDNVLGKGVPSGSKITVTYLITGGAGANGAGVIALRSHNLEDVDTSGGVREVKVIQNAFGGSDPETLESIKFYAPKSFEGQNRAVTLRDYQQIIPKVYPQTKSVNVWGGEDNIPAAFGRVYISIRPNTGTLLSDLEKEQVRQKLKKDYSVLTILPNLVDPDYTKIIITSTVKYDDESTLLTSDELKSKVEDVIKNFNDQYVSEFNNYFRYSNLVSRIDNTDAAITNNETTVELMNTSTPLLDTKFTYTFYFNNPVKKGTLSSNGFLLSGSTNLIYAEDGEDGKLKFWYMDGTTKKYLTTGISGTIDYTSGLVTISDATITGIASGTGNDLYIRLTPENFDVFPKRNQILIIDDVNQSIIMEADNDLYNNNYSISDQTAVTLRTTNS